MDEIEEESNFYEDSEFDTEPRDHSAWIKGFNEGYYIAKYMPELSLLLSTAQGDSLHLKGLNEGRNQYLSDKTKEHLNWLDKRPKDNRLVSEKDNEYIPLNFDEDDKAIQNNELEIDSHQSYIQYLKEQVKERLPSWLSGNHHAKAEKHSDKDRDIEPEPD